MREHYAQHSKVTTVTNDGVDVQLMSNIITHLAGEEALKLGAQGVGVFRTEF